MADLVVRLLVGLLGVSLAVGGFVLLVFAWRRVRGWRPARWPWLYLLAFPVGLAVMFAGTTIVSVALFGIPEQGMVDR